MTQKNIVCDECGAEDEVSHIKDQPRCGNCGNKLED